MTIKNVSLGSGDSQSWTRPVQGLMTGSYTW